MKTNKLVNCPQCGGFGFTSTPASKNYGITVCRAKTCELCHRAGVIAVPMTNADRIRSMSDEELAEFLIDLADDGNLRIRDWLKQPAGEEDKQEP